MKTQFQEIHSLQHIHFLLFLSQQQSELETQSQVTDKNTQTDCEKT